MRCAHGMFVSAPYRGHFPNWLWPHLQFSTAHLNNTQALVELIQSDAGRYHLTSGQVLKVNLANDQGDRPMGQAKKILKDIVQRVKN